MGRREGGRGGKEGRKDRKKEGRKKDLQTNCYVSDTKFFPFFLNSPTLVLLSPEFSLAFFPG